MFEQRTGNIFRKWMDVTKNPLSKGTRESYMSHINVCREIDLNVFAEEDVFLPVSGLRELDREVSQLRSRIKGDTGSSFGKFCRFLSWLIERRDTITTLGDAEVLLRDWGTLDIDVESQRVAHGRNDLADEMFESYERFIDRFNIDEDQLLRFGLKEETIWASEMDAVERWNRLRDDLLNDRPIYIRSMRNGLYQELYRGLFGNEHIVGDHDGNTEPIRAMAEATGFSKSPYNHPGCTLLGNYVLSHVFDRRSMNPLLFSNTCNFAFTPTLIDPFTGSATGAFARRFRREFRRFALKRFERVFNEYKEFVKEWKVIDYIRDFTVEGFSPREIQMFRHQAIQNWDPDTLLPE